MNYILRTNFKIMAISTIISVSVMTGFSQNTCTAQSQKSEIKTNYYISNTLNRELSSGIFYIKCAQQARKQGLNDIANAFDAAAKTNNEHYSQLKELAVQMRIQITVNKFEYPVMSTVENIKKAYSLEAIETKSYEEAIKTAGNENIKSAQQFYTKALDEKINTRTSFKNIMDKMNKD